MQLRNFTNHLNEELQDPEFKQLYEEEKRLLDRAVQKSAEIKVFKNTHFSDCPELTEEQLI